MVRVFVVNSGHLPLLRNALISIQSLPIPWKSVVFALDGELCPSLHQQSPELKAFYLDYAPRMLLQMQRDEPHFYSVYVTKNGREVNTNETRGADIQDLLINANLYGLQEILNCGLDIFLTEADTAFLEDNHGAE